MSINMDEYKNTKAVALLGGWRGAAGYALLVVLATLPFMSVPITTGLWLALVLVSGVLFFLLQLVESGAADLFNQLQQAKSTNRALGKILMNMKAANDGPDFSDGTDAEGFPGGDDRMGN
jgi:hypothetical protein